MPLEVIRIPIFLVLMTDIQGKLETFLDWQVIVLSIALRSGPSPASCLPDRVQPKAIIAGSSVSVYCHAVGWVVIAATGKRPGVINDALFSAMVLMIILTTLLAPRLIIYSLQRGPGED